MKSILKLLLLLILNFSFLQAQIFPISNNFIIQAGSSPVISDLCNSINPKLQITLQNKDFQRSQIDCRLWIRIEGSNGEVLETKQGYSSKNPITLFSGQIQNLWGDDIAPYLAPANMNMTGFDVQKFLKDGTLPEGNYTFKIIVYHWNGTEQLSSEFTQISFFNLSDPPLLTMPMDGSAVAALTPQSILFNWSPRHSPLPDNSLVEYKFELWEVLQNRNPQEVAQYQQPIQTLTTFNLNQLYDISHTNLDTGKTYAWRVRAQTADGKGYFRNNGYSEVYAFKYLAPNAMPYTSAPENFELLKANLANAEFKWDTDPRYQSYRLEYRVKNGNRWVPTITTSGEGIANQLEPDREYQAKVQGYNAAADIYGFYSKTIDFRTPKVPIFKCGETPDHKPLPPRPPLGMARKGDVIKMGGFNLYCTAVEGSGGIFSGEGIVNVPFLIQILSGKALTQSPTEALRTGFAVVFKNISVDDDYNLTAGRVDVVTKGWKSMMTSVMDNEYKAPMSNKPATSTIPDAKVDFVIGGKEDIKLDKEKGTITINKPGGGTTDPIKLDKDKPTTVIEDKAGNVYSVDNKTGEVTIVGAKAPADGPNAAPSIADAGSINPNQATVVWSNPINAIGGLDTKTTKEIAAAFSSKYEAAKMSSPTGVVYAPFKAVQANGSDYITAQVTITDKTALTDSVRFITLSGIILKPTNVIGSTYTLALTGKDHATMEVIVAQAKTKAGGWQVVGKLIQRNYKQDPKNLVLIPLGTGVNISKSPIEESLRKYYGNQGGVWNVSIASPVSLPANWQNKTSIDIDAGALSCYTAEMKEVISAYKSQGTYNEKDYYIFVSSIPSKNTSVQGEMPRGEHFGFVFNSSPSGDLIAHELGHGAYYFEHYWQEVKTVQQGSSGGNLMDYPLGSDLRVFQWDDIHERPADFISPCWKSDEAGQVISGELFLCKMPENLKSKLVKNKINKFYVRTDSEIGVVTLPDGAVPNLIYGYKGKTHIYSFYYQNKEYFDYGPTESVADIQWREASFIPSDSMDFYVQIAALNNRNGNVLDKYKSEYSTFIQSTNESVPFKYMLGPFNSYEQTYYVYRKINEKGSFIKILNKNGNVVNSTPTIRIPIDLSKIENSGNLEFKEWFETSIVVNSSSKKGIEDAVNKVLDQERFGLIIYKEIEYDLNCKYFLPRKNMIETDKSLTVFVSGFDLPFEILNSDINRGKGDVLYRRQTTSLDYWVEIDDKFMERLGNGNSYYIDGTEDISTSNHCGIENYSDNNFSEFQKIMEPNFKISDIDYDMLSKDIDKFEKKYYNAMNSLFQCATISTTFISKIDEALKKENVSVYKQLKTVNDFVGIYNQTMDYISLETPLDYLKIEQTKILTKINTFILEKASKINEPNIQEAAKRLICLVKLNSLIRRLYLNSDKPCKLNTERNDAGFKVRFDNGIKDGNRLADDIENGTIKLNKQTGKIDIVAHSMGVAHALGVVKALQDRKLSIGRFYSLAPENACSPLGRVPENIEEFWQYGSDETISKKEQDGVAPQCPAEGLDDKAKKNPNNFGRAYIPKDGSVPVGWFLSHSVANYMWIFTVIDNEKKAGYVKPRK